MLNALIEAFSGPGAAFMYAITAVLAFGLAVGLERSWMYWFKWRIDEVGLLDLVNKQQFEQAESQASAHPVVHVLRAGTQEENPLAVWDAMGSEAALVDAKIRQRVPYLASVGNISTMLGLLGTVYGLIIAFQGLSDSSAIERTTRLSEGIATAMATTAWGLLVGIPALALHAFLDAKAHRSLALCEAVASRIAAQRKG